MRLHWNDHLVNGIQQQDTGPAKSQVADVEEASDDITYRFQGAVSNQFSSEPTKKDDRVIEQIQNMARTATQNGNNAFCPFATSSQKGKDNDIPTVTQEEKEEEKNENNSNDNAPAIDDSDVINYPRVEEKAIDEYDPLEDIFPKVMPWLFPGGVGGPYDLFPKKRTMQDWGEACLYYEDGRFAKDKIYMHSML